MQVEKTVFISYRRTNIYMARAVYQDLTAHGYDCFLDFESIDAGSFARIILNQIAARAHFVVVLTPSALERCSDPADWLRREIEYALEMKRNVVPLMFDQFSYKDVQKYLVGGLAVLPQYNSLEIPPAYFEEAMARLRTRFLSKSLDVILHPTPQGDAVQVKQAKDKEAAQPVVSEEQLTAEQWFERGIKLNDNSAEEIECYTEALRLNPKYVSAYFNRGVVHKANGDSDAAIHDYSEAIRLNPQYADAYINRGMALHDNQDAKGAIADFSEAIGLRPNDAMIYNNRGAARKASGDLDGALADYDAAIRANPDYAEAYYNRGVALHGRQDIDGAITGYSEAIRLKPQHANAYHNRGIAYERKGDLKAANEDFQRYIEIGGPEIAKVLGWIKANEQKMGKH